jgi:hypothetical protein
MQQYAVAVAAAAAVGAAAAVPPALVKEGRKAVCCRKVCATVDEVNRFLGESVPAAANSLVACYVRCVSVAVVFINQLRCWLADYIAGIVWSTSDYVGICL